MARLRLVVLKGNRWMARVDGKVIQHQNSVRAHPPVPRNNALLLVVVFLGSHKINVNGVVA